MMRWVVIFCMFLLQSCGTLGGFDEHVFQADRRQLGSAIDTFYQRYPEYNVPAGWSQFDDWQARGYDFLQSRLFYFKAAPEEMYYVTFIGDTQRADTHQSVMAVRAVSKGTAKWLLKDDLGAAEVQRINERFKKEVVARLQATLMEQHTGNQQ